MRRPVHIACYLVALLLVLCRQGAAAQLRDAGGMAAVNVSTELGRVTELTVGQELRFDRRFSSLSRSETSVGAEFTIVRKLLKAEINYNLHYRRNDDERYEFRHRLSAGVVGQQRYGRFTFKLRTRGQATFRDERTGSFKYNPKYVWRNRLLVSYDVRRSHLSPYVSGEVFAPINTDNGFFLDSYRLTLGMKYELSKSSALDFQLRYDQDVQVARPMNVLYGCVSWDYSF